MTSKEMIDTSSTGPGQIPEPVAQEEAADLAELTANRPLQVLNEIRGTDPYNHTGRFSKPTDE